MALAIIRNDSAIRLSNKNISQTHKNKKNTVILYALFTNDMSSEPLKIDIEKVVKEKAPKYAKKIPGFLFRYLERTIHQDEINYILKTYKDSTGVKFADDLLSYMNVHINVIGKENIPPEGRFIFASNHPLGALDGVALIRFFGHFYSGLYRVCLSMAGLPPANWPGNCPRIPVCSSRSASMWHWPTISSREQICSGGFRLWSGSFHAGRFCSCPVPAWSRRWKQCRMQRMAITSCGAPMSACVTDSRRMTIQKC